MIQIVNIGTDNRIPFLTLATLRVSISEPSGCLEGFFYAEIST